MLEKIVIFGRNVFVLMIIIKKYDEIKEVIYECIDWGVIRLKVIGGYFGIEKELVFIMMNC